MTTAFQPDAFQNDAFQIDTTGPISGASGGTVHYRTHTDWDVNRERRKKRIEAQLADLEVKIEKAKKKVFKAHETGSLERITELTKSLRKFQQMLSDLMGELDLLNKSYNDAMAEEEAIVTYLAHRILH